MAATAFLLVAEALLCNEQGDDLFFVRWMNTASEESKTSRSDCIGIPCASVQTTTLWMKENNGYTEQIEHEEM